AEHVRDRAHPAHRDELVEEVLEGEALAADELGGHLLLLVRVERGLRLLDEREHVAHAEDPARHPVGGGEAEVRELLTGGREEDRLAGDLTDGEGGATAGVTVQFGEYDAGDAHAV